MVNYDKEKIFFTLSKAKKKLVPLILGLKKNPVIAFIAISLALVMIFFAVGSGGGRSPLSHPLQEATVPFAMEEEGMTGVMESVDPRDVWTAKIEQKVQDTKYALAQQFEEKNKAADIELVRIKEELLLLKSLMEQQQQLIENQQMAASLNLSNSHSNSQESASLKETKILGKSLGLFTKKYGNKKRNTKEYITSGTFARAVLMTGIVVGTGSNSAANPEPIMLRLTDAGIFSKGGRTEQITKLRECSWRNS
jgi:conjugal transfer pilus assembly protein TraB